MQPNIPEHMKAAAIRQYGGPEVLHTEELPVPTPRANEVLIRLDSAGVGVWDPSIRSGEWDEAKQNFPKILGNDGAGEVVAVGPEVTRFAVGDRVYAFSMNG